MSRTVVLFLFGWMAVAAAVAFPALAWLSPAAFMLLIPLGAVWIIKSEGRSLAELGIGLPGGWLRNLGTGVVIGLVIPVLFQAIMFFGSWIALAPRAEPPSDFPSYLLMIIIKMVFIAAIEEITFRGFFLPSLNRETGVGPAVLLSSLLWGAGHLTSMVAAGLAAYQIIIGMITFTAWGIALGICFLETGRSLWLPYGLHFGINIAFSLLGWFFISSPGAPRWWIGHPAMSPESGLIGAVVWMMIALALYFAFAIRKTKRKTAG